MTSRNVSENKERDNPKERNIVACSVLEWKRKRGRYALTDSDVPNKKTSIVMTCQDWARMTEVPRKRLVLVSVKCAHREI
jgi:hypothetical protein